MPLLEIVDFSTRRRLYKYFIVFLIFVLFLVYHSATEVFLYMRSSGSTLIPLDQNIERIARTLRKSVREAALDEGMSEDK